MAAQHVPQSPSGRPRPGRAAVATAVALTGLLLTAGSLTYYAVDTPGRGAPSAGVVKYYVVAEQPAGEPEFLWTIAQRTLGDGDRFPEIFELNRGRRQPDGGVREGTTTVPAGWILRPPGDAFGPEVRSGALPARVADAAPPGQPATGTTNNATGSRSGALALTAAGGALTLGAGTRALALRRRRPAAPCASRAVTAVTEASTGAGAGVESGAESGYVYEVVPPATRGTGRPVARRGNTTRAPLSRTPERAAATGEPPADPVALATVTAPVSPVGPVTPVVEPVVTVPAAMPTAVPAMSAVSATARPARGPRPVARRPAARTELLPPVSVAFGDDTVDIDFGITGPRDHDARAWTTAPRELPESGTAFVRVGSGDRGCLLLDLAHAPDTLCLTGDPAAAHRLLESLALQLTEGPDPAPVHAFATGPQPLADALAGLDRLPAAPHEAAALLHLDGRTVAVVLGDPGRTAWRFTAREGTVADG
ncbi:hypothetical protein [Streptomyces yaizuensis]|uniref:Uncharacterized protein n=1 Tax=Streptomyces yaizuensis TaxID=2989713 RepID=A0ABQ5P343_9ACTN|nr:hypothetical protein [Streptomyces sp. YSPA8]GLF96969.1 hypothetical protein SYYSPA8_21750 [Streptomyces sp. YSPA8]